MIQSQIKSKTKLFCSPFLTSPVHIIFNHFHQATSGKPVSGIILSRFAYSARNLPLTAKTQEDEARAKGQERSQKIAESKKSSHSFCSNVCQLTLDW